MSKITGIDLVEKMVISLDGTVEYFLGELRHNLNGPAVIKPDHSEEYWAYGERLPDPESMQRG